jgi:hypothetical protein
MSEETTATTTEAPVDVAQVMQDYREGKRRPLSELQEEAKLRGDVEPRTNHKQASESDLASESEDKKIKEQMAKDEAERLAGDGEEEENPYAADDEENEEEEDGEELTEEESERAERKRKEQEEKEFEEKLTKTLGMKTDELKELRFQKQEIERERLELEEKKQELAELEKKQLEIYKLQEQNKKDSTIAQAPRMDYDPHELMNREDMPDYVKRLAADDPELVKAVSHLMNDYFGQMMGKAEETLTYQEQKQQREQELIAQKISEAAETVKKEDKIDLNKMWSSPEFQRFAQDTEAENLHSSFVKRFGFGSVEYFRHMRDAFLQRRKNYMTTPKKENRKQSDTRKVDTGDPMEKYRAWKKAQENRT